MHKALGFFLSSISKMGCGGVVVVVVMSIIKYSPPQRDGRLDCSGQQAALPGLPTNVEKTTMSPWKEPWEKPGRQSLACTFCFPIHLLPSVREPLGQSQSQSWGRQMKCGCPSSPSLAAGAQGYLRCWLAHTHSLLGLSLKLVTSEMGETCSE